VTPPQLLLFLLQPPAGQAPLPAPGWLQAHGVEVALLMVLAALALAAWRSARKRARALAHLQLLAENTADLVFRITSDGTIVWIACSKRSGFGLVPEQLLGQPLRKLFINEDRPRLQISLAAGAAGEQEPIELRLLRPDGSTRWLAVWIQPLKDRRGRLLGYTGSGRDINTEMQAREARAASERRFELMMENAAIGMALVAPEGRWLRVNGALCRLLARSQEALLGCTWQEITHPADLEIDLKLVQQIVDGEINNYHLRKRFLRPDGSVIWGDLAVTAIRHQNGRLATLISQITDITSQIEAQEALAAREERFRMLAENASDVVLQADHKHRIIWASPSAVDLFQVPMATLLGSSLHRWVYRDDRATLEMIVRQLQLTGSRAGQYKAQLVRLRPRGDRLCWVSLRIQLLHDRGGARDGEVIAIREVTDQVELRQKLEQEHRTLQATLDSLLDPHLTLDPVRDGQGRVVDLIVASGNPAAFAYIRIEANRLIGSRLSTVLPGLVETGLMQRYCEAMETGEPLMLTGFYYPNHEIRGGDYYFDVSAARAGEVLTLTWRDVTERVRESARVRESEERYRLLAENSSDLVVRFKESRILWMSSSASRILGVPAEQWIGRGVQEILHPDDLGIYVEAVGAMTAGGIIRRRVRLLCGDGAFHWFTSDGQVFIDGDGKPDGFCAALRNLDAEVAAEAALDRLARYDQLTGLCNRSEGLSRLAALLDGGDPRRGRVGVLFVDVDKFKDVNDSCGHAAGDGLLQTIAQRLLANTREGDLVSRLGGDELLVALPGMDGLAQAVSIAETIRQAAREVVVCNGTTVQATLSIGVALAQPGESVDGLIARADQAMYQAKQGGRNQVIPIQDPLG
jgi:diguanylate cyclase (GGDEF)-like protein/PAS domain S-box-containing protein